MYCCEPALAGKGGSCAFGQEIIQVLLMFADGQVGNSFLWAGTSGTLSNDLFLREFELSSHPHQKFGNLGWMCFPLSSSAFVSQSYPDIQTHSPFSEPITRSREQSLDFCAAGIIIALPLFCCGDWHLCITAAPQTAQLSPCRGGRLWQWAEIKKRHKKGKLGAKYRGGRERV